MPAGDWILCLNFHVRAIYLGANMLVLGFSEGDYFTGVILSAMARKKSVPEQGWVGVISRLSFVRTESFSDGNAVALDEGFAALRGHGCECAKMFAVIGRTWLAAEFLSRFSQLIIDLKPYPDEKSDPAKVLETDHLALENAARFQRSLSCSLGC